MNTNDNRLKAHKLIDHIFQDLLPAHGMAQRPEQIQLSHRMLEAMQDGKIALCDAGTGIGKTYAYLAAATAASAFPTGQIARPIIISTSSIALQNAVLTEYLPLLSCVLMADGILTKATESGHPQRQKPLCLRRAIGQTAASGKSWKEKSGSVGSAPDS